MRDLGIEPNLITYNTLLDCSIQLQQPHRIWQLIEHLKSSQNENLKPDNFTFTTITKALKKFDRDCENLDALYEIIQEFQDSGFIKVDQILYNSIIDCYIKFKRLDKVEEVWRTALHHNVQPSSITYGVVIKAYGETRQLEKALGLLKELRSLGETPSLFIFGCLVDACICNQRLDKAIQIYEDMRRIDKIQPNVVIMTTLIKGFTREGNFVRASQLFKNILQCDPHDINIIAYNSMLQCCIQCGKQSEMREIYNLAVGNAQPEPDIVTHSTFIKGLCKFRKIEEALELYDTLKYKENLIMDEVLFNSLMDGCVKTHRAKQGLQIFSDMKNNTTISISNVTYSILIRIYAQLGDIDRAFGLLEEIKSRHMTPSIVVFTCLSQICVKHQMPHDLLWIFNQANRAIHIDQIFVKIILQGLVGLTALNEAVCVLRDLLRSKRGHLIGEQGNFVLSHIEKALSQSGRSTNIDKKLVECLCNEIRLRGFKYFKQGLYNSLLRLMY